MHLREREKEGEREREGEERESERERVKGRNEGGSSSVPMYMMWTPKLHTTPIELVVFSMLRKIN